VKPWNIELFGGSPDDNNAFFFYDGAMSVLQPMIDSGEARVPSGQMGMDKVGTLRWDGAVAQARMDNLLSANYGQAKVTACCRPMTACRSASSRRSRAWATARAT
jgi:putative multiple sugar transport system substrate-binding protein